MLNETHMLVKSASCYGKACESYVRMVADFSRIIVDRNSILHVGFCSRKIRHFLLLDRSGSILQEC